MKLLPLESVTFIIEGIWVTLEYTIFSLFFGFILGILLALASLSHIPFLRNFSRVYLSIFRGTPLFLQLMFIYNTSPWDITAFFAGVLAFSLNSAAYVCEIVRSGIQSIDQGQFLAAKSLGLRHSTMMKDIILPQALRNILPALVNEGTTLLKDSSIISVLGGEMDLLRRAQIVGAEHFTYFMPLAMAAGCYFILVNILSFLGKTLETKVAYHD